MKFILEIELGNEASQTYDNIEKAIVDAIHLPDAVARSGDHSIIRDLNGNTVGKWEVVRSSAIQPHPFEPIHVGSITCGVCGKYNTYEKYHGKVQR